MSMDSFSTHDQLAVGETKYDIFRLDRIDGSSRLPYSLKILLENLLRNEDGQRVTAAQIRSLAQWDPTAAVGTNPALHTCGGGGGDTPGLGDALR